MKQCIIYNAVPAYRQETAGIKILETQPSLIPEDLKKREGAEGWLILPKGAGALGAQMPPEITCIEADVASGLVYQNASALKKKIQGEKAIPVSFNEGALKEGALKEEAVSDGALSEWSSGDGTVCVMVSALAKEKQVCIGLPDGTSRTVAAGSGVTLSELIEKAGMTREVKAVYLGHPLGRLYGADRLGQELPGEVSYLKVIGTNQCILNELQKLAEFYRQETCGSCVFGHEGSAQIHMILSDMVQKKGKQTDLSLLMDLCRVMQTQTVCEVGRGLAAAVLDAVELFGEELLQHLVKKNCPAGVCAKFVTYHILADKCTGCNECADACGEEAILGKRRFIHVINQDECIQCGVCLNVCEEEAIVKAGAVKPRCPARPIPCRR